MNRRFRISGWALAATLAVIWCIAGCGKIVDLAWPPREAGTLWVGQFPSSLVGAVSVLQILAAVLICTGRRTQGILVGLALCVSLALAAFLVPLEPSDICGCAGSVRIGALDALSPLDHAIALSTMHVLALACLAPRTGQAT